MTKESFDKITEGLHEAIGYAKGWREAVKACAKVADDYDTGGWGEARNMVSAQRASKEIAAAIRALAAKENDHAEH